MYITRCMDCDEYSNDENISEINVIEYLITGQKSIRRVNNFPNFAVIVNLPNHPSYNNDFYSTHHEHNLIIIIDNDSNEVAHRKYSHGWNCTQS
jgi:hypothetical protein